MYLSQLILNPRSRRVQKELVERYELHRTLMQGFVSTEKGKERVLFRVETELVQGGVQVLVQSYTRPDWSRLSRQLEQTYFLECEYGNPTIKEFNPQFQPGQMLIFRLLANPTLKHKNIVNDKKQRVGIYGEDEGLAWLKRKAEENGFQVSSCQITPRGMVKTHLFRDEQRHDVSLLAMQFDGILKVTEPDSFLLALMHGIGSAKGFGFGLLSLARI